MNKKILTVLTLATAIVVLTAVPSLAQATQVQCGSEECANGTLIRSPSTQQLAMQTQNPGGVIGCMSIEFLGELTATQGETIQGSVTKDSLATCTAFGRTADITTNTSSTAPWILKVQQPAGGQVTGHLEPASGSSIKFTVKVQEFGFTLATCVFTAQDAEGNPTSIHLMGAEQEDTLTVEGSNQFALTSGSALCGTVGTTTADLTGNRQFETNETNPKAVVVHMS